MKGQLSPGQRIRDAVLRLPPAQAARDAKSTADLPLQPSTWSIRAALAGLFSFEFLFLLFLFAGRIKANPNLDWVPVDLTALLFALSVIAGALVVLTHKVNRRGLVITAAMGAFVTWLIVSRIWTPGVVYAQEKMLGSIIAFWACGGAAVIIAADRTRVRRFLTLLVVLAVWFGVEGAIAYATAESRWFVEISGTGYFGLSEAVSCGAVIAFATFISLRRFSAFRVMLVALFAVFFFITLAAGARQTLLGLGIVLLIAAVMGFRPAPGGIGFKRFQRGAWGILAAAAVAVAVLIMSGSMTQTLSRFQTLLVAEGGGRSALERQRAMARAVQFWASAPIIGHGIGSFPILENWVEDEKRHPHNIFLETLSELGLVGLILLSGFLLSALRYAKLQCLREDPLLRCVFFLVVFQFTIAMVGPDISEHRLFYAVLGLLALPPAPAATAKLDSKTATLQPGRILLGPQPRRGQQL